jgi:ribosome maturation protein Sdo1
MFPENKAECCFYKVKHLQFFVICKHGMVEKWREDKSIPIVDVLAKHQILCFRGNIKGEPQKPEKSELLYNIVEMFYCCSY